MFHHNVVLFDISERWATQSAPDSSKELVRQHADQWKLRRVILRPCKTTKGRCFLRLVAASGTVAAAPALLYK